MKRTIAVIVAGLLLTTVGLPAASAGSGDEELVGQEEEAFLTCVTYLRVVITECVKWYDPSLPDDTLDCIREHVETGSFVHCLPDVSLSDTQDDHHEDDFYECMKNGWFVGYCLEKAGIPPGR